MKIGFDAKRAAQNRTGLGNYSRFIIRILSEQNDENEYHLYIPKKKRTPYLNEIPTIAQLKKHFPITLFWRKLSGLWRVIGVTREIERDKIDIFHGLSNELPLNIKKANCKAIVTIHDLIFKSHPEYYHFIDRKIYDYKFRHACKVADKVIAVSEFTKREIIRYYHTPEEKIDVVYQGCDKAFIAPIAEDRLGDVRRKYNLPNKYVLYVGSIEKRKNLLLVARALKEMEEKPIIVAVGKRTAYTDRIIEYLGSNGLTPYFHFFYQVPFEDLPSIYRMATAFVYPSRIEGFGIPMLEALCSGVPAIGCTGSCLEEAGGNGSLYVDPDDTDGMAKAICRVMNDANLRKAMIEQGKIYARRFHDKELRTKLVTIYGKMTH